MDLLNKLTIKNLKLNKKRTIVTIVGIMLSVALLSAVCSLFMSSRQSLIDYETSYKGNYHFGFLNLDKNEIEKIKLNSKVEEMTIVETIGYAKLDGCKNELKPYVCLKASDKNNIKNMGIRLIEGRLPENDSELLITEHIDTNGGVQLKVGEKISLKLGERKGSDNQILNQDVPFQEGEKLETVNTKEFTIVGIIKRQASSLEPYPAPGYTVITCFENSELKENTKYDVYVRYNKDGLKNYIKTTANILEIDEEKFAKVYSIENDGSIEDENEIKEISDELAKSKYKFICNSYLIMIENGIAGDSTLKALGVVVIILFIIIIITSVFCIKNSFEISITEKIRQYGMLASIGATKKQIKRNVYYESIILACIGIPLGVVFGTFASLVIMKIANLLLSEFLTFSMVFKFSWLAVIFSAILGIITVLLSARKSAIKASKISPIVAIRNSGDIKIKAKKLKTPWILRKIFGIGGEIAYKNLKRSRKKYRTTVVSVSICVITFIAVFSFMSIANSVLKLEIQTTNYNFGFGYPNLSEEEYKKLDEEVRNWDEIDNATRCVSKALYINTDKFTDEYKRNNYTEVVTNPEWNISYNGVVKLCAIDKVSFEEYVNKLNLKYDEVKNKGILLNSPYGVYKNKNNKSIMKYIDVFDIKVGDSISGNYIYFNDIDATSADQGTPENIDIEIAKITNETPIGISTVYEKRLYNYMYRCNA